MAEFKKETLMIFPGNGINVTIVHDDREQGLGYYVDFLSIKRTPLEGCVFYSDNLNNSISFAKSFSENYTLDDLLGKEIDLDLYME